MPCRRRVPTTSPHMSRAEPRPPPQPELRGAAPTPARGDPLQNRGPAEACRGRCRGGARGLRAVGLARRPPGPAATVRRLEQQYGARSQAARTGRQQLFTQPAPNIYFFLFNTRRGPFADVRLRRAVNFAIDRRALAVNTGLGEVGRPTDQHIPPGLPGFEDAAIYPLGGPDLREARRLAGSKRRRAVLYTCDFPGCSRHGQILRSNLAATGIDLEVRKFPIPQLFERIQRPGRTPSTSPTRIGSLTTPTRSATSTSSSATKGSSTGRSRTPGGSAGWTMWQASRANGGCGPTRRSTASWLRRPPRPCRSPREARPTSYPRAWAAR